MNEQKKPLAFTELMMVVGRACTAAVEAQKKAMLNFAKAVNENQRKDRPR